MNSLFSSEFTSPSVATHFFLLSGNTPGGISDGLGLTCLHPGISLHYSLEHVGPLLYISRLIFCSDIDNEASKFSVEWNEFP